MCWMECVDVTDDNNIDIGRGDELLWARCRLGQGPSSDFLAAVLEDLLRYIADVTDLVVARQAVQHDDMGHLKWGKIRYQYRVTDRGRESCS